MDGNCHAIATRGSYSASNHAGAIVGGVLGTVAFTDILSYFCCCRPGRCADCCLCCQRMSVPAGGQPVYMQTNQGGMPGTGQWQAEPAKVTTVP